MRLWRGGFGGRVRYATVIGGNRLLLPKWLRASVGGLLFGLVEIRASDGNQPGWRDLLRGYGSKRTGVPELETVRRCDIKI